MRTGLFIPFLVGALLACSLSARQAPSGPVGQKPGAERPLFTDATEASGLDFFHFNGMSGRYYFSEITGSGGALFDYDNDGDLDLYLVQGRMLGPDEDLPKALVPPRHPLPLTDRLYRNDLTVAEDGSGRLRFTDVTVESQIRSRGYGMGVATGDYDDDGWVDLYVTNFAGTNELWHNDGDGTFSDVTEKAGVGEERWSVAASFFDYDRDGRLDLYVGNYLDFTLARTMACLEGAMAEYRAIFGIDEARSKERVQAQVGLRNLPTRRWHSG